jgi:hypothetical protein
MASGVLPARSAASMSCGTSPRAVSLPLARASLTITPRPLRRRQNRGRRGYKLQRLLVAVSCQDAGVVQGDVAGAAERRESRPDATSKETGVPERGSHAPKVAAPAEGRSREPTCACSGDIAVCRESGRLPEEARVTTLPFTMLPPWRRRAQATARAPRAAGGPAAAAATSSSARRARPTRGRGVP